MSGTWVVVRFPHVGDDLGNQVGELIRAEVESCPRCRQMYILTGHVPVSCEDCGATRGPEWILRLELQAEYLKSKNGVKHG